MVDIDECSPGPEPVPAHPDPSSISPDAWRRFESATLSVVHKIQPTVSSEHLRAAVIQRLFRFRAGCQNLRKDRSPAGRGERGRNHFPSNNYQKFHHHVRTDMPVDMMPFEELRHEVPLQIFVPGTTDHGVPSPMNIPVPSPSSQSPRDPLKVMRLVGDSGSSYCSCWGRPTLHGCIQPIQVSSSSRGFNITIISLHMPWQIIVL